jgi:hypothetical protein
MHLHTALYRGDGCTEKFVQRASRLSEAVGRLDAARGG